MAHSKVTFILTLLWLDTACPAAGSAVMRSAVGPQGELEMEQASSVNELASMFLEDPEEKTVMSNLLMLTPDEDKPEDLLPFVQNLKSKIPDWKADAEDKLKAAVKVITACNLGMGQGMLEAKETQNTCKKQGSSHKAHREDECEKLATKDHLSAKKVEAYEKKETECRAFDAVKEDVKRARTSLNSVSDVDAFVVGVKGKFCEELIDKYEKHKELCETAETAYEQALAKYENAHKAWTTQKTESDGVQDDMFESCCDYASQTKDVCLVHDECFDKAMQAYEVEKGNFEKDLETKKVEWRIYSRIECLLPWLNTDKKEEILKCKDQTHSAEHLNLEYPPLPDKDTCEEDTAFPGTPAYYSAHFAPLPDTCKGKAVGKCPGMGVLNKAFTTAAKCTDIEYTGEKVWGKYKGSGVALGKYTDNQLQFIGCVGNGCAASTFYCKDVADGITFGTTQRSAMRACQGVSRMEDCKYNGCCKKAGGLCNSPDKPVDATKLCQQLGYGKGTVESIPDNSCPESGWMGGKWSSDFVNSGGYGKSYTCSQPQTVAKCADIEYKMKDVWNYKGSGVALGKYTDNQLQFIGCVGNGCAASTFYCKDAADGITFGTTQRSAMRACQGVSRMEDCKYNGCCKKAGGLCNSPDKPVDATKLCQQLGYRTGTVEKIPDNSCPESGWMGGKWSSDFVNSGGYGKSYTCSQ